MRVDDYTLPYDDIVFDDLESVIEVMNIYIYIFSEPLASIETFFT